MTAGILDLSAAFLLSAANGVGPARVLQGIASGLLGRPSFQGGWATTALGAVCHFFVALSAAAVFVLASRGLAFLTRRPLAAGALYGVSVYLVMYWIVVPLSRIHRRPFSWTTTATAIVTHIVCVGLPISLVARWRLRTDPIPEPETSSR